MSDEIEDYWEDIRFYKPDPIIQLRAEEMARKKIAEEMSVNVKDYSHVSFDRFVEAMRARREALRESTLIQDLHERPAMLNEFEEAFRARRPR